MAQAISCALHPRPRGQLAAALSRPKQGTGMNERPAPRGNWAAGGSIVITETEFQDLAAQGYNRIPLTTEAFADVIRRELSVVVTDPDLVARVIVSVFAGLAMFAFNATINFRRL